MAWIIIEGVDRSGKSSVSKLYESKKYKYIHLSAPDKKYKESGYSGPSYLDDMLSLYLDHDGLDVVFDRSIYGESVWPYVYGRDPMLSEEDVDILREFEDRNNCERILMIDPDQVAHWKRCVDNNEPLTNSQFRVAASLYNKMAHQYGFIPKQLKDFSNEIEKNKAEISRSVSHTDSDKSEKAKTISAGESTTIADSGASKDNKKDSANKKDTGLEKLEKANAISSVLSKRIIKQRGGTFDELESEISLFLKGRLDELLGLNKQESTPSLSKEEVEVLKLLYKRFTVKDSGKEERRPPPGPRR